MIQINFDDFHCSSRSGKAVCRYRPVPQVQDAIHQMDVLIQVIESASPKSGLHRRNQALDSREAVVA